MSQCERILEVLRDGQWHRMEEIHQRAGFMRLNSRISELRARDYEIECDKSGGTYSYRLLGLSREAEASNGGHGVQGEPGTGVGPHETPAALTSASRGNLAVAPLLGRAARTADPTLPAEGDPAPPLFEIPIEPARPAWH